MTPCARALAGACLGAWAVAAAAQVAPAAAGTAPAPAATVAPKLSPLLGLLLGRLVDAGIESSTGDTTLGLFRRLARHVRSDAPAGAGAAAGEGTPAAGLTPALGYAMEQLEPATFAVIRPIPVAGGDPLLRTGDVFVLQFSTNLPGQVRLENTDANGRVSDLGTYNVLVDQLNRLPRDKGIQLQGQTGTERLRFLFYPCLPPDAAGKPWVADFQGRLPPCGGAGSPLQVASAGNYGTVTPRALVNLAQPDAHMVFAGSTEYQPGEVTAIEARIRHEGRSR